MRNRLLAALLPGLLLVTASVSGQRYNFTTYTIADGLPNNQVFTILQDQHGILWIGTAKGACRFDGRQFITFEQDNLLSQNPVRSIYEDSKGNIWLGMIRKGLCRFNGRAFDFFDADDGLLSDIVNTISEDRNGNIWIGTSEGLNRFDGKRFNAYTTSKGLVNNNVFDIQPDQQGNLWIATIGGISRFDGNGFSNYTVDHGLTNNIAYSILPLPGKDLIIGTYGGVSVFSNDTLYSPAWTLPLQGKRVQHMARDRKGKVWLSTFEQGVAVMFNDSLVESFGRADGLAGDHAFTSLLDREDNFWFGTDKGLTRYSGRRFETFTTDDGLPNNYIISVYTDSQNKSWFGTLAGGLSYYDGTRFRSLAFAESLRNSSIWSITSDKDHQLWLGTTSGAALVNLADSSIDFPYNYLNNHIVHEVLATRDGGLYFATDKGVFRRNGGLLDKIGPAQGLTEEKARVLYEDKAGTVWIGTIRGAFYLDHDSAVSFNKQHDLPLAPVTSITDDRLGNLLISTYDFGLVVYRQGKVVQLNVSNGLNNNRLFFANLDRRQSLWLGTPDGLDVLNWPEYLKNQKVIINHFGKSNGFFGTESNAASNDTTGDVWFGTVNGAIRYRISEGLGRQSRPLVRVQNIQLFLNDVDWRTLADSINSQTDLPENLVLEHDNNYLSFYVSGIYLTAPEELSYRFFLEGFDKDWSPVTKQHTASYSNVPPGEYMFKVKATANMKDWSEPVLFGFVIKPPVWKTPAFYIMYLLMAAGIVALSIQWRTRKLRKSQIILRKKVEMRTTELNEKNIELEKLSLVASEIDNAVLIFDGNMELEWVNVGFKKLTGYALPEVVARHGKSIFEVSSNPVIRNIVNDCIENKTSASYESVINNKDGKAIWLSSTLNPIFNKEGKLKNLVVVDTDISYRKEMEEQIKESLEEKGLLLKEIHHRVKNNLQIIISLFNLQSGYVDDEKAYKALREGQDRIKSMALIHERFYQSDGTTRIDFDDYIRRLCENLLLSHNIVPDKVKLDFDLGKISLDIDSAVPCGLIVNELVTNSIKHAFPGDTRGTISVSFQKTAGGSYRLTLADDGKGLPPGFDLMKADTLGMQLVTALTDQIEGTVLQDHTRGRGACFVITFNKA